MVSLASDSEPLCSAIFFRASGAVCGRLCISALCHSALRGVRQIVGQWPVWERGRPARMRPQGPRSQRSYRSALWKGVRQFLAMASYLRHEARRGSAGDSRVRLRKAAVHPCGRDARAPGGRSFTKNLSYTLVETGAYRRGTPRWLGVRPAQGLAVAERLVKWPGGLSIRLITTSGLLEATESRHLPAPSPSAPSRPSPPSSS